MVWHGLSASNAHAYGCYCMVEFTSYIFQSLEISRKKIYKGENVIPLLLIEINN